MPYNKDAYKPRNITCSRCHKVEDIFLYSPKHPLHRTMTENGLCFECAYWTEQAAHPVPGVYAINGALYKLHFFTKPYRSSSYKTRNYHFLINLKTREVHIVTDVVCCGQIPIPFKKDIPDQFKFITEDEYFRFKNYQADACLAKGCFDRYHCIWYDASIEEKEGPWNKVPKNYKIGGELCPSFINKHNIYDNL